ncbi:RNA polymerase sigma factor SigI [Nocardia sp. CDC153]|uniref:RNA polymerase sigma factor SigI n=1 Tax=Nocardia sp. CDC153 TaxID=3112167 RepID=UPI002DB78D8D|nr:RNA polymerase sigma factor SigI [Nocardia sp. CDC153]MEC3957013.1 RNA polymerase sigma factor SigI [Nocardia sp. CDC153]
MSTEERPDRFGGAWRRHRAYVVDLAFRLLGDIGGAEDAAQEAFARLARTRPGEVEDERAWLTVVTSRLCLDELRSARARRERADDPAELENAVPVAQAVPVDPVDRITLDEEVQLALYRMLQRLAPAERVVLILHDVFGVPFETVADTVGRPTGTCRQLARRARIKMAQARRPDGPVAPAEHRAVTERFIAACAGGDLAELLAVLDPRVWGVATFRPDSPIVAPTSRGAEMVAANMIAFFGPGVTLVTHSAFGRPALLAYRERELFGVLVLTISGERIVSVEATVDA